MPSQIFNVWIYPFLLSTAVCILIAPILIPLLKRLKFGQSILKIGPSWHQKKSGTPTMGGVIFILAIVLACSFFLRTTDGWLVLAVSVSFGVIGFIDDFIKVVLKRNLGLTATQKLLFQIAVSVVYLVALNQLGYISYNLQIPYTSYTINLGIFYIPFLAFLMLGFVNAVNLTDGLDGLATSVTFVVILFFALAAFMLKKVDISVFAIAVAGGCLGFLVFNKYPAKVFMGDTGSLFLGGAVSAVSICLKLELLVVIAGIVYVIEALSVILQVISFKLTGKRLFKMSPIHHHFEMSGYSEVKIVLMFVSVTILACILAFLGINTNTI